jgi:hypothetical protein
MVEHPKLAICAIVKDEARYIEEWLAFHFLQGVSQVLIFDNENTDGTRDILKCVARHLPISVVNWPGQDYYQVQMEAYRDGAMRLTGQADWVAFIDIDEFLFSSRCYSIRTAEHAGRIYLDLADEHWRAVEIGPDGWQVIRSPPVRFRRPAGIAT